MILCEPRLLESDCCILPESDCCILPGSNWFVVKSRCVLSTTTIYFTWVVVLNLIHVNCCGFGVEKSRFITVILHKDPTILSVTVVSFLCIVRMNQCDCETRAGSSICIDNPLRRSHKKQILTSVRTDQAQVY